MMGIRVFTFLAIALTSVPSAAQNTESRVFTLYRNSILDEYVRIHIATFDANEESATYNAENCQVTARLFQEQQGVNVKYWCEKGRFEE